MSANYDLRKIQKLLNNAFDIEELRGFCLYEPEFKEVYNELKDGSKKSEIIRLLIDYAERKGLLDMLLAKIKADNPRKYGDFEPYVKTVHQSGAPASNTSIKPSELNISPDQSKEVVKKQPYRTKSHKLDDIQEVQKAQPEPTKDIISSSPASSSAPTKPQSSPEKLLIDFLIVTALEEERDAVLDKLPGYKQLNPTHSDIRVYYQAELPVTFPDGSPGKYQIILISLLGMGRVQATISTADAIRKWQPRFVMLVGIAGGIAEAGVKLGDILVSNQIVDYELQKLKSDGPDIRWQVHQSSSRLREIVLNFGSEKWHRLIKVSRPTQGKPKRHIGPIISGDKVIASSEVIKLYRATWPKLIGVEMEGGGVAVASFQAAKPPEFLMVRGVSDLADEQKGTPKVEKWRAYACEIAAAYAIGLLQSGPVLPLPNSNPGKKDPHQPSIITSVEEKLTGSDIPLESPYGMMSPDSKFYIERKADQDCWKIINESWSTPLYIQAPRQMGKSSLMYRMLDRAKREGICEFGYIDFQMIPEHYLKDAGSFFKEFCRIISNELGISETVEQNWRGLESHLIKCSDYVSKYIIPRMDKPIIIALDELERTLNSPFREDFFGMLRGWYTRRVHDKNFAKLKLFLSSSTDPYLLIEDPNQSPFNVARRIILDDFSLEQVNDLNRRHKSLLEADQISTLATLLGGHPYLTRLAFYLLELDTVDFDTLLSQATEDYGPFGDHLNYYYLRVMRKPELKRVLVDIYRNQTCEKDQPFYQLQEAGMIRQMGQKVVLRNELYHRYFKERLDV